MLLLTVFAVVLAACSSVVSGGFPPGCNVKLSPNASSDLPCGKRGYVVPPMGFNAYYQTWTHYRKEDCEVQLLHNFGAYSIGYNAQNNSCIIYSAGLVASGFTPDPQSPIVWTDGDCYNFPWILSGKLVNPSFEQISTGDDEDPRSFHNIRYSPWTTSNTNYNDSSPKQGRGNVFSNSGRIGQKAPTPAGDKFFGYFLPGGQRSNRYLYQTVKLHANATYTMSFDYNVVGNFSETTTHYMLFGCYSQITKTSVAFTADGQWHTATYTFTWPGDEKSLEVMYIFVANYLEGTGTNPATPRARFLLDNIQLQPAEGAALSVASTEEKLIISRFRQPSLHNFPRKRAQGFH